MQFSEGLETIGYAAFAESRVESVALPASLRTVSQCAFIKCRNLRTVKFREGLEVLGTDKRRGDGGLFGGVFQDTSVERVELPSTLRRIEYQAFAHCRNLRHIDLPDGLEYIGKWCFENSSIVSVRFPPGLKAVEASTF